jgi:hypothetical protein
MGISELKVCQQPELYTAADARHPPPESKVKARAILEFYGEREIAQSKNKSYSEDLQRQKEHEQE